MSTKLLTREGGTLPQQLAHGRLLGLPEVRDVLPEQVRHLRGIEAAVEEYIYYYGRYQAKHKRLAPLEVRNQTLAA